MDGPASARARATCCAPGDERREVDYLTGPGPLPSRRAARGAAATTCGCAREEDFELGLRLRATGVPPAAASRPARARHWSAPRPSLGEVLRRWRTGLCYGQGQVLRLYLGRAGLGAHLRRQAHYFATLALWLAAPAALVAGGPPALAAWALAPLALLALMTLAQAQRPAGAALAADLDGERGGTRGGLRARGAPAPPAVREASC